MFTHARPRLTEEQYLALERAAEQKSEYLDGEVFALAGSSRRHAWITGSILTSLRTQLRGRDCRPYATDLRVKASAARLYTYPDIVVVCGEARLEDAELDTLLNPTLIIEILSSSTEGYDRGKKFEMYRTIPSFAEYVLVSQERIYLEHHVRQPDRSWLMTEVASLDETVRLPTIACTLALRDVYEAVDGIGVPTPDS